MWMFKGQSETGGQCGVQQGQLLTSLTTYIELYSSQKDYFKNTADYFSRITIQAQEQDEESQKDQTTRALLAAFCGGSLGATIGVVCGGVAGSMGAVIATVIGADVNAVSASVGFFGGLLGGVVGATFAGFLGGAVGTAAESSEHSIDHMAYYLLWGVIGGATGGGIGHIFGGEVGTVAGSLGGGFGAFCAVSGTVGLTKHVFGEFNNVRKARNSQGQKKDSEEDSTMQIFQRNTSPLIAELSVINTISSKLGIWAGGVAVQSSFCLIAISRTKKALADVQNTPKTASCLKKAAKHCINMCEELEMMKCEAEKRLASWSKQDNTV